MKLSEVKMFFAVNSVSSNGYKLLSAQGMETLQAFLRDHGTECIRQFVQVQPFLVVIVVQNMFSNQFIYEFPQGHHGKGHHEMSTYSGRQEGFLFFFSLKLY